MIKRKYNRQWYLNSKEKLAIKAKTYYSNNKEKFAIRNRGYYSDNKDKVKEYQLDNKEKIKKYQEEYQSNNKDKAKDYHKEYYSDNKDHIGEQQKKYESNRRKTDLNFKIRKNLRSRLNRALKGNFKSGSAVRDLGCSIEDFKYHIEWNFKMGMDWSNYGYWHLDHIIPLSSFNLSNREEFLKASHYTNYQALWAEENLKKRDKIL